MASAPSPPSASPPPADIIHSVPPPSAHPPASPSPSVLDSPTKKTTRFPVFSPRAAARDTPSAVSRRLFSPVRSRPARPHAAAAAAAEVAEQLDTARHGSFRARESDESTGPLLQSAPVAAARRGRRRRLFSPAMCACFGACAGGETSLEEVDYGHHLKTLKPTYEPQSPLLPNPQASEEERICLVLDLDETLVHSSFTPIAGADFEIPLEMQGETHTVYVKKRPGVDEFLLKASQWYEIVVFTASLALYANPVMDLLDPKHLVRLRLYREHCVLIGGCYVKDIAKLGRDLKRTLIIDNSPLSYVLQPENAIPITAFFTDESDRELEKTLALLEQAKHLKDVRKAFS